MGLYNELDFQWLGDREEPSPALETMIWDRVTAVYYDYAADEAWFSQLVFESEKIAFSVFVQARTAFGIVEDLDWRNGYDDPIIRIEELEVSHPFCINHITWDGLSLSLSISTGHLLEICIPSEGPDPDSTLCVKEPETASL